LPHLPPAAAVAARKILPIRFFYFNNIEIFCRAHRIKKARGVLFSEEVSKNYQVQCFYAYRHQQQCLFRVQKTYHVFLCPAKRVCRWFTQLLLALDYLHCNRVLHRDLKVP
jgi:hypothetical protein